MQRRASASLCYRPGTVMAATDCEYGCNCASECWCVQSLAVKCVAYLFYKLSLCHYCSVFFETDLLGVAV